METDTYLGIVTFGMKLAEAPQMLKNNTLEMISNGATISSEGFIIATENQIETAKKEMGLYFDKRKEMEARLYLKMERHCHDIRNGKGRAWLGIFSQVDMDCQEAALYIACSRPELAEEVLQKLIDLDSKLNLLENGEELQDPWREENKKSLRGEMLDIHHYLYGSSSKFRDDTYTCEYVVGNHYSIMERIFEISTILDRTEILAGFDSVANQLKMLSSKYGRCCYHLDKSRIKESASVALEEYKKIMAYEKKIIYESEQREENNSGEDHNDAR